MFYEGLKLSKGNRVIRVLFYGGVESDHRTPTGTRRGIYFCEVNGHIYKYLTSNISRLATRYKYRIDIDEDPYECRTGNYLHAHHALKHQENCSSKSFGLWQRFKNYFHL